MRCRGPTFRKGIGPGAGGGGGVPAGPWGNMDAAKQAIKDIESSGGNYGAVNSGSGATGAYQVMPANIGPWTEKYYGKRLTQEEFKNNREAQDKVFEGEFGRLMAKYGPEGLPDSLRGFAG